ncbi:MAG TPA: hypothetical protein VHQ90_16265 [Thermoanaerobaculia bacterium]|nr:hypothetical protein [Thermoanaerobaculia bacterium]
MAALPASAQNLLVNPNFDHDLSGWLTSARFDPAHDANGSSTSGSALLHGYGHTTICQCAAQAVTPGVTFDFGGSAGFLDGGEGPYDSAFFTVSVYSDGNCGGTNVGRFVSSFLGSPSRWSRLRGEFRNRLGDPFPIIQDTDAFATCP